MIFLHYVICRLHGDNAPGDVWGMFYTSIITDSYANDINIPILSEENDKIFIFNCKFCNFQSGCISVNYKHSINFLHSSCFFYSNFNPDLGGSIYFSGDSSIVQHRSCAYNTTTTSEYGGSFSFSSTGESSSNFNYYVECSLTHCNKPSYHASVLYGNYGAGLLSSSNSSQNSCDSGSGYTFRESNPSATINYTTIANNTAKYYVACHSNSGNHFLTKSNIINNEISDSGNSNSAIVYSNSQDNLTVDSCCFFGNKPSPGNLLHLKSYYGQSIVKNCHIDSFSANDEIEKQNITDDASFFFLPHLSAFKCNAEIPFPPLYVNTEQIVQFFPVFIRIPNQIPEVFFGAIFTGDSFLKI